MFTDFNFTGTQNIRINNSYTEHISAAKNLTVTWRFQKNNNNGQKLTFTSKDTQKERCPVRAELQIRARAQRYNIAPNYPLSIYRNVRGQIQ